MNNFIFYDTETSSVKELNYIQAIQIGSILTNSSLEKIDSFRLICAPLPWTLITPKALLINKKEEIFNSDITHYQMIKNAFNKWSLWSSSNESIFISYNGMRFDEEIMRRQFYWNLLDPYLTNTNNNSRLDVLMKMYVIGCFYQDSFPIPYKDDSISLRLEILLKYLKLIHINIYHDALEDCDYLKQLLNEIKSSLPNFYNEFITTTSKIDLFEHLITNEITLSMFLHIFK